MKKIIFVQDLPGSGKTTFCKNFCKENNKALHVEIDILINTRIKENDKRPLNEYFLSKIKNILKTDFDIFLLDFYDFSKIKNFYLCNNFLIDYVYIKEDINDCLDRYNKRMNKNLSLEEYKKKFRL